MDDATLPAVVKIKQQLTAKLMPDAYLSLPEHTSIRGRGTLDDQPPTLPQPQLGTPRTRRLRRRQARR